MGHLGLAEAGAHAGPSAHGAERVAAAERCHLCGAGRMRVLQQAADLAVAHAGASPVRTDSNVESQRYKHKRLCLQKVRSRQLAPVQVASLGCCTALCYEHGCDLCMH